LALTADQPRKWLAAERPGSERTVPTVPEHHSGEDVLASDSSRILRRAVTVLFVVFCVATPLEANSGLPMIALIWPWSWKLLVPIVLIETVVAVLGTPLTFRQSLVGATAANVFSTVVAIPITWVGLFLLEILFTGGGRALGLQGTWRKVVAAVVQAPWLVPYENDLDWMVPSAIVVLLIPFFFISVFAEAHAFRVSTRCEVEVAKRWSRLANSITYACLLSVFLFLAFRALGSHDWSNTSKNL